MKQFCLNVFVLLLMVFINPNHCQVFEVQKEEISGELNSIELIVDECISSLSILNSNEANIQLNIINSLENLVNEELQKKRLLINNFENCIQKSTHQLDSLESLLLLYSNIDTVTEAVKSEFDESLAENTVKYQNHIDSLQFKIQKYLYDKAEIINALNMAENNFGKEFNVMKKNVLREIKKAELELRRSKKKAENELKKKLNISLPTIK